MQESCTNEARGAALGKEWENSPVVHISKSKVIYIDLEHTVQYISMQ